LSIRKFGKKYNAYMRDRYHNNKADRTSELNRQRVYQARKTAVRGLSTPRADHSNYPVLYTCMLLVKWR